ncbi:MAG: insulinase family protein [Chlamydiales bacterium]|nr:insulinase family protein [Chlamydiales bacterium]
MSSKFLASSNDRYKDYVVIQTAQIDELNSFFREIVHEPSGATIFHFENNDPENFYCIAFQTRPENDKGALHVLEHMASSKNTNQDFLSQSTTSLYTSLRATTNEDFTVFYASSLIKKDFYNLLKAQIDGCFYPCLSELLFFQEGCRIELKSLNNINSGLRFNGVVYNEMKNKCAEVAWHHLKATQRYLLPNCYRHNHGGSLKGLRSLTCNDVIASHEKFYKPSNCIFTFYGNFSLQEHLNCLEKQILKDSKKTAPLSLINQKKEILSPITKKILVPKDLTKEECIAFSWLTTSFIDHVEKLALLILENFFDNIELFNPILNESLAQSIQAQTFDLQRTIFQFTCYGCSKENLELIQAKIFKILKELTKTGLDQEIINNAFSSLEIDCLELIKENGGPPILKWCNNALQTKFYGGNVIETLKFSSTFKKLKKLYKTNPSYFQKLINKYLLKNPDFTRLIFVQDSHFFSKEELKEQKELSRFKDILSQQDLKTIKSNMVKLSSPSNISLSPLLLLSDIPVKINSQKTALTATKINNIHIFHHPCVTNGLVYLDLMFELPGIKDAELLALLPLLCNGSIGIDGEEILCRLNTEPNRSSLRLHVKGLSYKIKKLFTALQKTITPPFYSQLPTSQMLFLELSTLEDSLSKKSFDYVYKRGSSGFSANNYLEELWNGISYFKAIKNISHLDKTSQVIEKLSCLKKMLYSCPEPHLLITCNDDTFKTIVDHHLFDFSTKSHAGFTPLKKDLLIPLICSHAIEARMPIASTCQVFRAINYLHKDYSALLVATNIFENILYNKLRKTSGAYGPGIRIQYTGDIALCSSADAHIAQTLDVFKKTIETVVQKKVSAQDITKAQFSAIRMLDTEKCIQAQALSAYKDFQLGITNQTRQVIRNKLLEVTPKQISNAVEEHLFSTIDKSIIITLADANLIAKENKILAKQGQELPVQSLLD